MKIEEISNKVSKELDEYRWKHSIGVAYTAASLAMRYGADINQAYMAGILHDCAKNMTHKERLKYCKKNDIKIDEKFAGNPEILHAYVGAYMAEEKYHCKDENILNAIKYHTTGRAGMSLLEEIIFLADYIEPGRDNGQEGLHTVRSEAFIDIKRAVLYALESTINYLEKSEKNIAQLGREAYEYYSQFKV